MQRNSETPVVSRQTGRTSASRSSAEGPNCESTPQSPPNFPQNSVLAYVSLVFTTPGGYKPFGC